MTAADLMRVLLFSLVRDPDDGPRVRSRVVCQLGRQTSGITRQLHPCAGSAPGFAGRINTHKCRGKPFFIQCSYDHRERYPAR